MDTVYSLSGGILPAEIAAEAVDEAAFQPGSLVSGSVREICSIRRIAAGGAVLHADMPGAVGQRLELELESGDHLDGTIAWRRGCEIGLNFDDPIDVLAILARNLAAQPGERRRVPRVEVFCDGLLETANRRELVRIRDIAQGGAKLDTPFPLAPEEELVITPEGLRPLEATVRWSSGCLAGVRFRHELEWQELMPWLRLRRDRPPSDLGSVPPPPPSERPPEAAPDTSGDVQLNLPARVREGTRRWTIEVTSLTARGVEFECFGTLRLGTLLWIVLPGLEGWPARIVAIDGYRFICEFTQPLHPAVLERVIVAGRSNQARA